MQNVDFFFCTINNKENHEPNHKIIYINNINQCRVLAFKIKLILLSKCTLCSRNDNLYLFIVRFIVYSIKIKF